MSLVRDLHGQTSDGHLAGDDELTLCRLPVGVAVVGTHWQPVHACPTCTRVLREGTGAQRTVVSRTWT